jgi:hypothetical protein
LISREKLILVAFREHYVVIIEPSDFNIYKNCTEYSTFGFVIGSRTVWFHDYIIDLVSQYLEIWQVNYRTAILNDVRSDVSHFIHSTVRNNTITVQSICALAVLAYYIAASQGKKMYLRYFTTFTNKTPLYYTYFGVKDYECMDLMKKIIEQTRDLHQEDKRTFFFINTKNVKDFINSRR